MSVFVRKCLDKYEFESVFDSDCEDTILKMRSQVFGQLFLANVSNSLIAQLLKKNREKLLKRWAIKLFGEFGIDVEFEKEVLTKFRGRRSLKTFCHFSLRSTTRLPPFGRLNDMRGGFQSKIALKVAPKFGQNQKRFENRFHKFHRCVSH